MVVGFLDDTVFFFSWMPFPPLFYSFPFQLQGAEFSRFIVLVTSPLKFYFDELSSKMTFDCYVLFMNVEHCRFHMHPGGSRLLSNIEIELRFVLSDYQQIPNNAPYFPDFGEFQRSSSLIFLCAPLLPSSATKVTIIDWGNFLVSHKSFSTRF